jgi:hypothetical protein
MWTEPLNGAIGHVLQGPGRVRSEPYPMASSQARTVLGGHASRLVAGRLPRKGDDGVAQTRALHPGGSGVPSSHDIRMPTCDGSPRGHHPALDGFEPRPDCCVRAMKSSYPYRELASFAIRSR